MAGIWDYPEAAASTLTLQNSTCYVCRRMTGEFQWYYPHDTLRTAASEARTVRQAWAAHPQSESARAAFCRPYSLHAVQNPYHRIPGMDIGYGVYSGANFARLHNVYEGTLPRLIEGTLRVIQKQVTAAEFNRAGKAIDTWLISTGACFKSIGTGFSKGLSHYFYGNILDSNNPWGTTISFGKITSQDVYKDICRFWRVLLVDLLPNAPEFIALFSDYFDWIRLLNNRHHTDATLARLDRFCEFWMEAAVRLFGKELLIHGRGTAALSQFRCFGSESSSIWQSTRRTSFGYLVQSTMMTTPLRRQPTSKAPRSRTPTPTIGTWTRRWPSTWSAEIQCACSAWLVSTRAPSHRRWPPPPQPPRRAATG